MAVLSRNDLERMSYDILINYSCKRHMTMDNINPFFLANELLGLTVDFTHLSQKRDILGLTSFSDVAVETFDDKEDSVWTYLDGRSILIEKDLDVYYKKGIKNFTILHECAHHILKRTYPESYGIMKRSYEYRNERKKICDWDEWQADTLASFLLMPAPLIYEGMEFFDMHGSLADLPFGAQCVEFYKFNDLCDRLGCSRKALMIRFNQLGLNGDDYINDPAKGKLDIYERD